MIDESHDPNRQSWVATANRHRDFPIQNLPFGIFRSPGGPPQGGVAIGEKIFDLRAAMEAGLFDGEAEMAATAAAGATLNPLLALGPGPRRALRARLVDILDAKGRYARKIAPLAPKLLHRAADCVLDLPLAIGDYTDFYAGIHHAAAVGKLLRPDNPLMPNYKYVPVAYHGRASSVRPSGIPVIRPSGQRHLPNEAIPSFGPCRNLDYELELGVWIGPGNEAGRPIPIAQAGDHVAGLCLLNDWSARDIQAWEYQPLGPFLAKNFATTVSPWLVTVEALAPFRKPQAVRPQGDPRPLRYLWSEADQTTGAFDIALEVLIETEQSRRQGLGPERLSLGNSLNLYWTTAQMVAHHSSNGCNLKPGDLFGTGTISGIDRASFGSLIELTRGGKESVTLKTGETRRFLEDEDEITFRGRCSRNGFAPIGFGVCRARIVAAEA